MPSLSQHHSSQYVKLLLLGDAKSGKTRSLVSLVNAGYKLRILDMDNLLDPLKGAITEICPDKMDTVEYRPIRDNYEPSDAGMVIKGKPKAWIDSIKMLNKWAYTDPSTGEIIDFGSPASWPDDCILVIDSLSRWCDAAFNFHEFAIPKGRSGEADGRMIYSNAQDDVEKQLAALTSPTFTCNVIVVAHGVYQALPDGTTKIFPQGVGQKLSPKIPQYFPNYIRYTKRAEKRTIQLASDAMIDLANTRPDKLGKELPAETGLADFFAALRESPAKLDRPKSLTLRKV